jgi:hypothetical protein
LRSYSFPSPTSTAKAFYVDQVGFHADHDQQVNDGLHLLGRDGRRHHRYEAGPAAGVMIVVDDVESARQQLIDRGVQASAIDIQPWVPSSPSAILTATYGPCSSSPRTEPPEQSGPARLTLMSGRVSACLAGCAQWSAHRINGRRSRVLGSGGGVGGMAAARPGRVGFVRTAAASLTGAFLGVA